jgi:hypothetical protein
VVERSLRSQVRLRWRFENDLTRLRVAVPFPERLPWEATPMVGLADASFFTPNSRYLVITYTTSSRNPNMPGSGNKQGIKHSLLIRRFK